MTYSEYNKLMKGLMLFGVYSIIAWVFLLRVYIGLSLLVKIVYRLVELTGGF